MANRDFDPFASASHGPEAFNPEFLPPLAKAKLDEFFLQWLSQVDVQEWLAGVISGGILLNNISPSTVTTANNTSPPPRSPSGGANLSSPSRCSPTSPTLRSPPARIASGGTAFLSPSSHRSAASPSTQDVTTPSTSAAKTSVPSSDSIPVFYVKQAKADLSASVTSQSALRQAFDALSPPNLTNFIAMARDTLSLSSGCAYLLFNKICNKNGSEDEDLADSEKFVSFWQAHSVCTPNQVLFRLLVREGRTSITSSDFADIVRYVALTHPGLDFLKATPEFQDRYCECVIEQIIYFNTCDLSHSLSQRDVCNSDLSEAFLALDEEDDINKFTKYFSYQHFYVLYCKFWELDTDHDFLVSRDDLLKLSSFSLTYRMVDRFFSGARALNCTIPDRLDFKDFIWILMSEEDKSSVTSQKFWFRMLDIDDDGALSAFELEYFYKEQQHRMEVLSQEVVTFGDMYCQMHDLVKPEVSNVITLTDLRRCGQAGTFLNAWFNLNKFLGHESRDAATIFADRSSTDSDWIKYAKVEYLRLSFEEEVEANDFE